MIGRQLQASRFAVELSEALGAPKMAKALHQNPEAEHKQIGDVLKELLDAKVAALTEACQRNGWLKSGGYPWQDDPFLEEYPYSFSETGSVEALADFFRDGNWSLRQGIVYKDLAFINQVDGGDEWWTHKNAGDRGWLDFESISCGRIAERDRPKEAQ